MRRWIAGAALLAVALAAVLGVQRLRALSYVGAGVVAKQMCSCVFVAERSFDSCLPDLFPEVGSVHSEVLLARDGVRAWVPFLAERVARHREDRGCTLQR